MLYLVHVVEPAPPMYLAGGIESYFELDPELGGAHRDQPQELGRPDPGFQVHDRRREAPPSRSPVSPSRSGRTSS